MRLKEFRVTNYRSINDSGPIEVRQRTALVGRNESGKTNILLALKSLNPSGGPQELSLVKDFPRERSVSEFSTEPTVVQTIWELSEKEQKELEEIFPRTKGITEVMVERGYRLPIRVEFRHLSDLVVDQQKLDQLFMIFKQSLVGNIEEKDTEVIASAVETFSEVLLKAEINPEEWSQKAQEASRIFRQTVNACPFVFSTLSETQLASLEAYIRMIQNDNNMHEEAMKLIVKKLPVFIYLDEYPELEGHQDLNMLIGRQSEPSQLTLPEKNFLKLMKVAELNPSDLQNLLQQNHEMRQLLTNRAGARVTKKIRELWTDRQLKIRFNLDAQHFDTLVSDPNSAYDVDVNLNERSRGFKWFFSFYVTFAADTTDSLAENAILLLDEPGLYLHAVAQRDLLTHFGKDFHNQIIYTTHSPFMIPVDDLSSIRTVNIEQDTGTAVSNDPMGDSRTLFPLQAALGYDLAQTLFVGAKNVVVEGVTDFWYLSSFSDYLNDTSSKGLSRDVILTPAGGAGKVSYMATLLVAQNLKVLVLFDDEKKARETAQEIIRAKLIHQEYILFASDAFSSPPNGGVDIEDLLEPDTFHLLVKETYKKELEGKTLTLNDRIPRIVKRYEEAFKQLNLEFYKTRPARLFLRKMAEDPELMVTNASLERFGRLFQIIREKLQKQVNTNHGSYL